jgi:hypothetical protein
MKGTPMRPFGLLLAACLCTCLLYDRFAGRFPSAVLAAAAAPEARNQTLTRPETRLEKLQHFEVLLRLVAVEHSSLKSAEESWRFIRDAEAEKFFKERPDKYKDWEPFRQATQKFDSEIAKAIDKRIQGNDATKQYLETKAFVEMLEHERDAAREALKRD